MKIIEGLAEETRLIGIGSPGHLGTSGGRGTFCMAFPKWCKVVWVEQNDARLRIFGMHSITPGQGLRTLVR